MFSKKSVANIVPHFTEQNFILQKLLFLMLEFQIQTLLILLFLLVLFWVYFLLLGAWVLWVTAGVLFLFLRKNLINLFGQILQLLDHPVDIVDWKQTKAQAWFITVLKLLDKKVYFLLHRSELLVGCLEALRFGFLKDFELIQLSYKHYNLLMILLLINELVNKL